MQPQHFLREGLWRLRGRHCAPGWRCETDALPSLRSKDTLFREALTGLVNELLVDLVARSGSCARTCCVLRVVPGQDHERAGLALHRMLVPKRHAFPNWHAPSMRPGRSPRSNWLDCCVRPWHVANCARATSILRRHAAEYVDRHAARSAPLRRGATAPQQAARTAQIIECFYRRTRPSARPCVLKGIQNETVCLPLSLALAPWSCSSVAAANPMHPNRPLQAPALRRRRLKWPL